jgi:hypothetical protein
MLWQQAVDEPYELCWPEAALILCPVSWGPICKPLVVATSWSHKDTTAIAVLLVSACIWETTLAVGFTLLRHLPKWQQLSMQNLLLVQKYRLHLGSVENANWSKVNSPLLGVNWASGNTSCHTYFDCSIIFDDDSDSNNDNSHVSSFYSEFKQTVRILYYYKMAQATMLHTSNMCFKTPNFSTLLITAT